MSTGDLVTWAIAVLAAAGVVSRPGGLPEAIWSCLGAAALVIFGLLPWQDALAAIGKGLDVYLFLTGMMLLSEVARREGLFDWIAAHAVGWARGSARRLFLLIYGVGIIVTAFLSNDATAVVLTPAVYAATRAARAEPLPYLLICALIANAASFLLPISNPANLVLYASRMPPLAAWVARFALPSLAAIIATYAVLRLAERQALRQPLAVPPMVPALSAGGLTAALGILVTAVVLLSASAADAQLGLPTCIAGLATVAIVLGRKREAPLLLLAGVSWAVLPLVAGLFVLVAGLGHTGVLAALAGLLHRGAAQSVQGTATAAGIAVALGSNLINNLPAGLIAGSAMAGTPTPDLIKEALLLGVDLGPNLSVTGSLATILWLIALRREGETIAYGRFLRLGILAMPPALLLALASLLLTAPR